MKPCAPVAIEAVCSGSAREMGLAQGEQLRDKIAASVSILEDLEAFRLQRPSYLPPACFRELARFQAKRYCARGLKEVLPESRDRLEGMSSGSGVSMRDLCLLNVMEAVLSDLSGSSHVPVSAACSAMAVTGDASKTGSPILAHSFDYLPVIQPLYAVRENRPSSGLRSLEFTVAPLCGAVDGINEAGLCITYNYAYTTDNAGPAPTLSMLISEALRRFRTVPEAVEFLASPRRSGGGLLMLGDSAGNIASLELSATRHAVREGTRETEMLFHTNRFQTDSMPRVETDGEAFYSRRAPAALRGCRVHQTSDRRDERFGQQLAEGGVFDAERIHGIMSDHGSEGEPSADTICMHSDYWYTTACIQMLPRAGRMRVSYSTACQAEFSELSL